MVPGWAPDLTGSALARKVVALMCHQWCWFSGYLSDARQPTLPALVGGNKVSDGGGPYGSARARTELGGALVWIGNPALLGPGVLVPLLPHCLP